jgi:hypothetical protein
MAAQQANRGAKAHGSRAPTGEKEPQGSTTADYDSGGGYAIRSRVRSENGT